MLHQRVAGLPALDEPERCRRARPALGERGRDDLGGAPGQPRVARVRLDDDGAAGREGRGGVAAGDREREREVRAPRTRRPARADEHPAQVGPRRGGRRVGVVDGQPRGTSPRRRTAANRRSWPVVRPTSPRSRASPRRVSSSASGDELVGGGVERVGRRAQPRGALGGGRGAPDGGAAAAAAAAIVSSSASGGVVESVIVVIVSMSASCGDAVQVELEADARARGAGHVGAAGAVDDATG